MKTTQVRGIVTRDMIDRGENPSDRCPVAQALKVGVLNPYAEVYVKSKGAGGDIIVYGKPAIRDEEFQRVRAWVVTYDVACLNRKRSDAAPIAFTLTFDGEFS